MPIRRLVEQPVVGGERFSAVIGSDPRLRVIARWLLLLALGGTAVATALAARAGGGTAPAPLLWGATAAFLASLAAGWLAGDREHLVCEGHHVIHRRAGPLGLRRRTVRVLDLTAVRRLPGRVPSLGGIRLETAGGTWTVARSLPPHESELLIEALRRHLSLSRPVSRPRSVAPGRSAPRIPEPADAGEALRRRLPEG